MIILLDLDGTLTNTARQEFKLMKDGKAETNIENIPVFDGAVAFVQNLANKGHIPLIVSDSHPKYVKKIAQDIFDIDYLSLCDKPNISKIRDFLKSKITTSFPDIDNKNEKDSFILIGDSWLDIEAGRRLNIRTILTRFYKASNIEQRDGIGQDWKPVKIGPTYFADTYEEITNILNSPIKNLLAIEAIFQGQNSNKMVKFLYREYGKNFTAFRCLARQEDGECDRFSRADKYYQIDRPGRNKEFLERLAQGVTNYLSRVERYPEYQWDILTYVSDKKTTKPPNKMKEIFDLIESNYPKYTVFEWSENVEGKLRLQPNYKKRRAFIAKNLRIKKEFKLNGKSVIVIDDQFTSSATANEISYQLRKKGAKNILFIALFYLILPIESKTCPRVVNGQTCGKPLMIKIRKSDGNRFYSCVPEKYGGTGCGYTENIRTE